MIATGRCLACGGDETAERILHICFGDELRYESFFDGRLHKVWSCTQEQIESLEKEVQPFGVFFNIFIVGFDGKPRLLRSVPQDPRVQAPAFWPTLIRQVG